ncbi:hypothetical protein CEXT_336171 [Caerostris extrusa]|uniref:Uncharacterized protein n=1 Tax=Caerostris extrusa TaxID=172846 RepID=A0AAV4Q0X7_CAEEX|nr:hypothetical protein CEXT_336171 [Caerostris extrusa]
MSQQCRRAYLSGDCEAARVGRNNLHAIHYLTLSRGDSQNKGPTIRDRDLTDCAKRVGRGRFVVLMPRGVRQSSASLLT